LKKAEEEEVREKDKPEREWSSESKVVSHSVSLSLCQNCFVLEDQPGIL